MADSLYRFISAAFQHFIWGGEIVGDKNLPNQGPAILISNHLDALGPIACTACIPRSLCPWIAADVMDTDLAPEYLRWDFVEKELHLSMPLSLWVAKAISKISVPLLNKVGCVPVYTDAEELHKTFDITVDLLMKDNFVLI